MRSAGAPASGRLAYRRQQASKIMAILRRPPLWRGLAHKVAAAVEHEPVLRARPYATVVDIGANIGQFALATRAFCPSARVIAFEPLPAAADRFEGLFRRDDRVRLHRLAIGPAEGPATLHVSRRADSSSLLPIGEGQMRLFPGTEEDHVLEVEVRPLDRCLRADDIASPALLKIDVQGFELEVLKGCTSLLDRFTDLYVECSHVELYQGQALLAEVEAFLQGHGFHPRQAHNEVRDGQGRAVQADMLFTRQAATGDR